MNSLFYFLAFEKLDPNLVNALLADEDLLKSVLLYHVLPSEVNSDLFQVYDTLDTLLQGNLLRGTDNCSGAARSIHSTSPSHCYFTTLNLKKMGPL